MAQAQRRLMARVGTAQMQAALYYSRKKRRAFIDVANDVDDEEATNLLDRRDFTTANWHPESGGLATVDIEMGTLRHDGSAGAQKITCNGSAALYGFGSGIGAWQLASGYSADHVDVHPTFWIKKVTADGSLYVADLNGSVWTISLGLIDPGWQLITQDHVAVAGNGPTHKTIQFIGPTAGFAALFGFEVGDVCAGFSFTGQTVAADDLVFYLDDVNVLEAA